MRRAIFLLWSTVLAAGVVAAVTGKILINNSKSTAAVLAQAVAGGALLAPATQLLETAFVQTPDAKKAAFRPPFLL